MKEEEFISISKEKKEGETYMKNPAREDAAECGGCVVVMVLVVVAVVVVEVVVEVVEEVVEEAVVS